MFADDIRSLLMTDDLAQAILMQQWYDQKPPNKCRRRTDKTKKQHLSQYGREIEVILHQVDGQKKPKHVDQGEYAPAYRLIRIVFTDKAVEVLYQRLVLTVYFHLNNLTIRRFENLKME
jgi:hypothetical protein